MDVQQVKQRFGIVGNAPGLLRAIDVALQVAPTDLSVLITGESGVGKESFPQIIHQYSARKHGPYIAVNCGAIPEGTIDSELFGHEKGAFTGATDNRKGYFEVAGGGTIFLDEVAELPLSTQVRLLRVLETGEYIKVGSSKIQKTNVRVIAATNVDISAAIREHRFREDLYYRLCTVPIFLPALRERTEDIILLFRKFASDFSDKYRMPPIRLGEDAKDAFVRYSWPGNIRQLKNVTEQISIIETQREVSLQTLTHYISPNEESRLPALNEYKFGEQQNFASEREILYKVLFDMRNDITDLKKLVREIISKGMNTEEIQQENAGILRKLYQSTPDYDYTDRAFGTESIHRVNDTSIQIQDTEEIQEDSLSITEKEIELIRKALEKYDGKRKPAAGELGISERTLYRKIKEYDLG